MGIAPSQKHVSQDELLLSVAVDDAEANCASR